MADFLGPGVSRVLVAEATQYLETIWQQGKPPTDAELNLMQQLSFGAIESAVLRGCPSGFLGSETNSQRAFTTNPQWSNFFRFGNSVMWANVNGMLVPVTGTRTGAPPGSPNASDLSNIIVLDPPPGSAGSNRVDFVFLEVWRARVIANSATNKPAVSSVYRFGNVEGGYSYLADDLIDPMIGVETTQRVQVQYRIRVVQGVVGLTNNPDGFDPAMVKAQGAAGAPVTSFSFQNMRELGDPGLWRAGDGTENLLGTVDGYSYAIPIAVVFRRNSIAWVGSPSTLNLNGGFNRNPTATNRTGILGQSTLKIFSTDAVLSADLSATDTSASVSSVTNTALPNTLTYIQIGDEVMTYQTVSGTTLNTLVRGPTLAGTEAEAHKAGSPIKVLSGRPDGLFSDQIVGTDILDLRKSVNPNGFDYSALLHSNLDKLLRGQLRANWKYTGSSSGGPQGVFIPYQDVFRSGGSVLDAPDGIRTVFSDAAVVQPVEIVVTPRSSATTAGTPQDIQVTWGLQLQAQAAGRDPAPAFGNGTGTSSTANTFSAGDIIRIPSAQLKNGLQSGSASQVRWLTDVQLRVDGETADLPSSYYLVDPITDPNQDLVIRLTSAFPVQTGGADKILHIRAHVLYGAGRGLSRRPDALHSVTYYSAPNETLIQTSGNLQAQARVAWVPLWSKYHGGLTEVVTETGLALRPTAGDLVGGVPVTAEMYADLGSKTLVATPFRQIQFPDVLTLDGSAANPSTTPRTIGAGTIANSDTLTVTSGSLTGIVPLAPAGAGFNCDALVISSVIGAGRYSILSVTSNLIKVDRPIIGSGSVNFVVYPAQGVMPLNDRAGATKWSTTDPLGLFCGCTHTDVGTRNIYVTLPRHLMPGWGELQLPMMASRTNSVFSYGLNFMVNSRVGAGPYADGVRNYVNLNPNVNKTFATFATHALNGTQIAYNTATSGSDKVAGLRLFDDPRKQGRKGLELPPFYGVARLFAVYESSDYWNNGSSVGDSTRNNTSGSGAKNLLKQGLDPALGPTLWVEIDGDGDSTFVLNANMLDLSKSPTTLTSFEAGRYVVEASVFGFDRGTFDPNQEARLVLTRPTSGSNTGSWTTVGGIPVNQSGVYTNRAVNVHKRVTGPTAILPGPVTSTTQVVVNYSRTPYQGDAWGTQNSSSDIPYTVTSMGPVPQGRAYQIASTRLDSNALTRPNQKVLEVLAAVSFSTSLGTGRLSGNASSDALNVHNVGWEDQSAYPPATSTTSAPLIKSGNFVSADVNNVGTDYLGSTERLPLGSLFRDKDFRGQSFSAVSPSPFFYSNTVGAGRAVNLAVSPGERFSIPLETGASIGSPGDILVHVDGEQVSSSSLSNYRTSRGGSVFVASGMNPGGAISLVNGSMQGSTQHVNVLQGRAMLVRNSVTTVGVNEVSPGDELMLLVVTTVNRPTTINKSGNVVISTNGEGEGYSAADLYRIEGHPVVRDNTNVTIDPVTIRLPRIG